MLWFDRSEVEQESDGRRKKPVGKKVNTWAKAAIRK